MKTLFLTIVLFILGIEFSSAQDYGVIKQNITYKDITYKCRSTNLGKRVENINNCLSNTPRKYKTGGSIPADMETMKDLTPEPFINNHKKTIKDILYKHLSTYVNTNFTKNEKILRKTNPEEYREILKSNTRLSITIYISSETGKIQEIQIDFSLAIDTEKKEKLPPIEFFYNLEKEIRDLNLTFQLTAEGRKRNYCSYYDSSIYCPKLGGIYE